MAAHIDWIALEASHSIEDEFAKGHAGGVTQRSARIQVIVIDAIRKAVVEATNGLLTLDRTAPEKPHNREAA